MIPADRDKTITAPTASPRPGRRAAGTLPSPLGWMRVSPALSAAALGLVGLVGAPPLAQAGSVKGTVTLPSELKTGRRHRGYWRVENGNVPIQPAAGRTETVVVLEGPKGQAPAPATVTVEIAGLQASRPVVVVGEGSVVEFKNSDKVAHDLSTPEQSSVMPLERLNPGALRRQKFMVAGGYTVRCSEYPHIVISVLVVSSPYHALADDKGSFKLPDAPDGKATIKVWSQGRWVHEQPIEVGAKSADLQIKVPAVANKQTE